MAIKIKHSKAFDEGIATLIDEIKLAIQWSRPSILLAVHTSKRGQDRAMDTLALKIQKQNQQIVHIQIENETNILSLFQKQSNFSKSVFFITGLGEKQVVYSSFNLHREFFVEQSIRAIFWLTEAESINLPRFAPDFWAFRHRVVEFAPGRVSKNRV